MFSLSLFLDFASINKTTRGAYFWQGFFSSEAKICFYNSSILNRSKTMFLRILPNTSIYQRYVIFFKQDCPSTSSSYEANARNNAASIQWKFQMIPFGRCFRNFFFTIMISYRNRFNHLHSTSSFSSYASRPIVMHWLDFDSYAPSRVAYALSFLFQPRHPYIACFFVRGPFVPSTICIF